MARVSRSAELGLVALTIEGGLIAPEQVQKIVGAEPTAKTAEAYACPKGTSLKDEVARYFRIGQAIWRDYARAEHKTIERTAAFAHDLLEQCLGFGDLVRPAEHRDGTRRYRLAWEAKGGRVPIVVAAPVPGADAFAKSQPEFGDGEGGRPKRSPAALLQDWLNANPTFYWGLVFAGDRVRLLRDNASLTRPAWIEVDLGTIFAEEAPYSDFIAFWLVFHATRFGAEGAAASDCALEQWREAGLKQGVEARADLRNNVEDALRELGQGLVEANPDLADRLKSGALTMPALFEELLRTVYRLIFLAVAEDRDLLHPGRVPLAARALYADGYSFTFWRERSRRRVARDAHHDAWEAVKVTLASLEQGEEVLGLPALGGLFAHGTTPSLNQAKIPNRRFLAALFSLGFIRKDSVIHRINWRDLKTEELGSVYESLLEIRPSLSAGGEFVLGSGAKGNDRKTSGSYYTPDSLVETLLDSALDPVLDTAEAGGATSEDKIAALLDLKVIDPACGSGHFLLGAARRMADRVARLRNEDAGKEETQAALRDVVSRCIHGVDRNPMAVELAKVALWIESVSPGKPLGFLDANLRCGDALLGVFDLGALEEGIPDEAYKPLTGDSKDTASGLKKLNKAERDTGLLKLAFDPTSLAGSFRRFHRMPEATAREVAARAAEFERIRLSPDWQALRQACDLYVAAFLLPKPRLADLREKPLVPTTGHLRTVLSGGMTLGTGAVQGLLAAAIDTAAYAARAFHWPLEFPDVLLGKGGFDCVLGNPPWERIKLQEQEFFAGTEIADAPNADARTKMIAEWRGAEPGSARAQTIAAFDVAKRIAEASSVFFTAPKDDDPVKIGIDKVGKARRYPWTGRGDVNTYALFAEHFLNLTRAGGRAGVIVPTGIATDATTAPFFGALVSSQRLAGLTDFENRAGLFPAVDSRMKFCLLTIGYGVAAADFAFFLTDTSQLEDERRRFKLSPGEIASINPNSKTSPVFRSRRDAELTAKVYSRIPVLAEDAKSGGDLWSFDYMTKMFDMADSSHLFRTVNQFATDDFHRKGSTWVGVDDDATQSTATMRVVLDQADARNAPDLLSPLIDEAQTSPLQRQVGQLHRFVPLYEAKMIHQFDHRWTTYDASIGRDVTLCEKQDPEFETTPRYWIDGSLAEDRLGSKNYKRQWLIGWRDITNATNERTVIASAYPAFAIGHSIRNILLDQEPSMISAFLANLSAIALDFVARQQVGGTHLTVEILKQLPILPPSAYSEADLCFIVPRVLELSYTSHAMAPFARDLGYDGAPFAWDEDRRAQLRAELDAWYALAYGLTRDELRYVLDPKDAMGPDYPSETFRVLQNNETKKFGEYRTQRLVLAAYDALIAAAPDTQSVPAAQWDHAIGDETDVRLLLTAIVGQMRQPRTLGEIKHAFLFAAQPHLLTPHLSADRQAEWRRLVGNDASLPVTQAVTPFSSPRLSHFLSAQTWLASNTAWRFDIEARTVDRGAAIYGLPKVPWAEGRAAFVWHAMRAIDLTGAASALPQAERAFVVQSAAA